MDSALAKAWLAAPQRLTPDSSSPPWRGLSPCGQWFVKYREAGPVDRLRNLAKDRFGGALALGLQLEQKSQPISAPLALIEGPSPNGAAQGRWLVTRAIQGQDLAELVASQPIEHSIAAFARLGPLLADFHDSGFRQRDLKAPNIMETSAGQLVLVDLEGMAATGGPAPWELRAKDLGRLGASFLSPAFAQAGLDAAHWNELLRRYVEACHKPGWDLAKLERKTRELARRKVQKNQAEGRPLA